MYVPFPRFDTAAAGEIASLPAEAAASEANKVTRQSSPPANRENPN
jgi:hypothetical protein